MEAHPECAACPQGADLGGPNYKILYFHGHTTCTWPFAMAFKIEKASYHLLRIVAFTRPCVLCIVHVTFPKRKVFFKNNLDMDMDMDAKILGSSNITQ
jgi:hypothetical protein